MARLALMRSRLDVRDGYSGSRAKARTGMVPNPSMITRGFPGQVRGDGRSWKSGVGHHASPDHVVELDEPSACGRRATTMIRRPSPRALVWFGEDLDAAELDRVGYQQAKRGDEQCGDFGFADVG
jgi:hypothetical protein